MDILVFVFTAIIMVLTTLTIISDTKQKHNDRLLFKTMASMCFLFLGFLGLIVSYRFDAAVLFAALVACVAGDILLAYYDADRAVGKYFVLGVAAFSAAQIFISIHAILRFGIRLPYCIIIAVVIAALAFGASKLFKMDMQRFTVITSVYALLIAFAFANCLLAFIYDPKPLSGFVAAGMAFFIISDVILLFKYFRKGSTLLTAFNLYTYYLGVTLLAASLFFA